MTSPHSSPGTIYCHGHNRRRITWVEEDRDHDTPCWIWTGTISERGYGLWSVNGVGRPAHRMLYERMVGPIPDGLVLDHLCSVLRCVNPAHLEPVTAAINSQRGRSAKLTADAVREIRSSPKTVVELAEHFDVSPSTVQLARRGKTWRNVEFPPRQS